MSAGSFLEVLVNSMEHRDRRRNGAQISSSWELPSRPPCTPPPGDFCCLCGPTLAGGIFRVSQLDVNDACWQVIEAETQLRLGTPLPLHLGNPTLWFLSWFSDLFLMIFYSSLAFRALDSKMGKGPRLGRLTIK